MKNRPDIKSNIMPINGYIGRYEVDKNGMIWSLPNKVRKGRRRLKPQPIQKGYLTIMLSKNGGIKLKLIHRIVATAFIPNPKNKPQVNHKNGIKEDNRVVNLEWSTAEENIQHAFKLGLKTNVGENNSQSKLSTKDVLQILKSQKKPTDLAQKYNVSPTTISDIKMKRTWSHL